MSVSIASSDCGYEPLDYHGQTADRGYCRRQCYRVRPREARLRQCQMITAETAGYCRRLGTSHYGYTASSVFTSETIIAAVGCSTPWAHSQRRLIDYSQTT